MKNFFIYLSILIFIILVFFKFFFDPIAKSIISKRLLIDTGREVSLGEINTDLLSILPAGLAGKPRIYRKSFKAPTSSLHRYFHTDRARQAICICLFIYPPKPLQSAPITRGNTHQHFFKLKKSSTGDLYLFVL